MKTSEIHNGQDVIDSRDIISRIDDLQSDKDNLQSAIDEAKETLADLQDDTSAASPEDVQAAQDTVNAAEGALKEWEESDEGKEFAALLSLQEECEGYTSDWRHGEALIRESYWVEYVQQMLEDIGDLPKNLPGYIAIDWDKTADNILVDYTSADFDGVTYYIRNS